MLFKPSSVIPIQLWASNSANYFNKKVSYKAKSRSIDWRKPSLWRHSLRFFRPWSATPMQLLTSDLKLAVRRIPYSVALRLIDSSELSLSILLLRIFKALSLNHKKGLLWFQIVPIVVFIPSLDIYFTNFLHWLQRFGKGSHEMIPIKIRFQMIFSFSTPIQKTSRLMHLLSLSTVGVSCFRPDLSHTFKMTINIFYWQESLTSHFDSLSACAFQSNLLKFFPLLFLLIWVSASSFHF